MKKYLFFDDYSEGAHPQILEALIKTNLQQEAGYGDDIFSGEAKKLISDIIKDHSADIHFVSAGTQSNFIILAGMMKPFEAVISADSGHINVHEAGAVEATGHKVITIANAEGKINPRKIKEVMEFHKDEHMVKPKVVYISHATELGTIYTKNELESISECCKKNGLYLYLDGARLGSAVRSRESDLTLPDITRLVDAYYIGGTKNGAFLGEAVILVNDEIKPYFRYHLKQRGALLAKGRLPGVQFRELFRDGLFFRIAEHLNNMADRLACGIRDLGFGFLVKPCTNQVFPVLPDPLIRALDELYGFYVWEKVDKASSAIRLVTSWSTREEVIDGFLNDLKRLVNR
ncbi:MAG: aminotransferase class V-fold PLP-dependent enzyme [Actinobacteria bacterium]|nr:aminotransferase class V-fold PLP-dependent enzyme [Actinomycetota bacterium]